MRTIKEQKRDLRPLAARMRPRTLDEFIGQEKVVGKGTPLRQAIEQGSAGSVILWGPPGVGKTTLAYVITKAMQAEAERISAVAAGVKDLRAVIERATQRQERGTRTVLIVDEIHRFNRAQQDVLLPVVEEGGVTLIGATTENPYFEVVAALVSRAPVVRLDSLTDEHVRLIVQRALTDKRGFGKKKRIAPHAEAALVAMSGGDARRALTILERAAGVSADKIGIKEVASAAQQAIVQYDKKGDAHYDTISAFIKSLRGSDPDAALFYLFRMLVAGEEPRFIMRRMLIFASEDIGNADPHALMLAAAASQALEWVGLPEAEFALAHAATYLAAAPKSNSVYKAMDRAKEDVARHGNATPPPWITNAPIAGMKQFGTGVGYQYPHDFPGHLVKQQYRPDVIQKNIYYEPGDEGFEKEVKKRVERARAVLGLSR
jgi:putative ATPase